MTNARQSPLLYYGWAVLAASAVIEMLAIGATSYSSGLFVLPLQSEYGLSRADASSSILILNFGAIFMAPFAGRFLDRQSIKYYVCAGALCFSLALAAIALTSSLTVMVLALLLPAAAGFTMLGPMNTATLASRWFFRHRGLALGIAAIATSGGGLVVTPFLSAAIQTYGWRSALLGEAVIFFVIIVVLALLVLKDNPFQAGLSGHKENDGRPDGEEFSASHAPAAIGNLLQARSILGDRRFWAPSLLLTIIASLCQVIIVSTPAYGHQLGFSMPQVVFLISAFSVAGALTKITAGVMADHWNKRTLLFTAALFMPLALALLCAFTSYAALLAAVCLAGIALGGCIPATGALIAARFGAARFGSVFGWTYALIFFGTIALVRFAGTMFDIPAAITPPLSPCWGFRCWPGSRPG